MLGIKDAVKKIYYTENALQKHIILFMLAGFTAMLSVPLNELSSKANLTLNEWSMTAGLFILSIVVSLYVFGYVLRFIRNSFDKEIFDMLPEFSKENFKVIWKAMPILLSWFGYFMLFAIAFGILFLALLVLKTLVPIIILTLLFIFIMILLPMVFVNFSRTYEWRGLLGIHKPFTYLKKCGKGMFLTILKLLPVFLIMHIINILCMNSNNVLAYIIVAIMGYVGIIYQMTLYFCYGQILQEKFYNE